MFTNFCTPITFHAVVEIVGVSELQSINKNDFLEIKVRGVRRRMKNGERVYHYDDCLMEIWSSGAKYAAQHMSVGDVVDVTGEVREASVRSGVVLRVTKFDILTPTEDEMESYG
jgi:hypothetical protein